MQNAWCFIALADALKDIQLDDIGLALTQV